MLGQDSIYGGGTSSISVGSDEIDLDVEVSSKSKERQMPGRIVGFAGVAPSASSSEKRKLKLKEKRVVSVDLYNVDQPRHCIPWETPTLDPQVPPFGCLRALRERYFVLDGRAYSHRPLGKNEPRIGLTALQDLWQKAAEEDAPQSSQLPQERALVYQQVVKSFQALNIRWVLGADDPEGSVDICEWLHRMLMLLYPPGPDTDSEIKKKLESAGPKMLPRLVGLWMRMDRTGKGFICKDDLAEAFREFRPMLSLCEASEMATGMLHDMDSNGLGQASYSEFVLLCLGMQYNEVSLYYYDLSQDWAKYISPLLLGSSEAGVWHTGIAVCGREYFFGSGICHGLPGATIWGQPMRALKLGLTMRTLDELQQHICTNLDRKFNKNSYDVLECNCNHFANEVAQFLLGSSIPDEVRLQPERIMSAPVASMLRPLLRWLGHVEQPNEASHHDKDPECGRASQEGA